MRYKKLAVLGVVFLTLLFSTTFTITAQAQTFGERIPTFGLYCDYSEVIKSGIVNFDLTDTELLSKGIGFKYSEYQLKAANCEVEFTIPFFASAQDRPTISVMVNGQKIKGTIWYGERAFAADEFEVGNIYSTTLDEGIMGTLYTVVPDNDTIMISLSNSERISYVYETSFDFSATHTVAGNTWTLRNALAKPDYEFFIVGDASSYSFSSSSNYQMKTITCKEFIDGEYAELKEYYDVCDVPIEFFYSIANKMLQHNLGINYQEFYFSSITTNRLNAYKFSIPLETDVVVSYELPINVQRNYAFKPIIYLVEQKQFGSYPVKYNIELNNDVSHIIESSGGAVKNGKAFTIETAEDFYFVFSSLEKPTDITVIPDNGNRIILIACIVAVGAAVAFLTVMIGFAIYRHRSK